MNRRRLIAVLSGMALASMLVAGAAGARENVAGKTYYTATNIWYSQFWNLGDWNLVNEQARRIESTNIIRGKFIPAGTAVMIKEVNDKESDDVTSGNVQPYLFIRFLDPGGAEYKILFIKIHAAKGQTIWDLFGQYFTGKDPMEPGGPFSSLSAFEQEQVKKGLVAPGMSKKAVLMAYGYPPGHRTPSLDSNKWIYWTNPFKTIAITFENDVVVGPQVKKKGKALTVEERLKQLEVLKENGLISQEEYDRKRAKILESL